MSEFAGPRGGKTSKFPAAGRLALGAVLILGALGGSSRAQGGGASETKSNPTADKLPAAEHKISPKEEAELFRSVDDILQFASTETGLPKRQSVGRRLVSRDEVVAYLTKHMDEDEDSQRFRRSEVVLKKFGLIPKDFDLRPFLIGLLREQIAGYYDPATKTVNLLDWVAPEQQKPVLAHELTHALQDQKVDMQKWMKGTETDLIKVESPTSEDFELDEAAEARQAVVEGQATVSLIDYQLIPAGKSVAKSPQIVESIRESMLIGTADSGQYQKAPLFLKEAITFPYRYGLGFVGEVVVKRGKAGANALFDHPPVTTRQIMEPETYLSGEKLSPMPVVDFKRLFKDYETVDVGGFGEFDTFMLVGQLASRVEAQKIYPAWRGGYYFAVRPKGKPAAPLGLLYVSRWASAEKAAQFAAIYAKGLTQRYLRAVEVGVEDSDPKEDFSGGRTWNTEEGPVLIETHTDLMVVVESLEGAGRLAAAVFGAPAQSGTP